jgi:hypothetical protein
VLSDTEIGTRSPSTGVSRTHRPHRTEKHAASSPTRLAADAAHLWNEPPQPRSDLLHRRRARQDRDGPPLSHTIHQLAAASTIGPLQIGPVSLAYGPELNWVFAGYMHPTGGNGVQDSGSRLGGPDGAIGQ